MCFLLGPFYRDNFLVISWSEVFGSRDKEALAARQGSVAKYTCNPGKTLWHRSAKSRCWYFSAAPAGRRHRGGTRVWVPGEGTAGLEPHLPHGCLLIPPSEVNSRPGEATRPSETPLEARRASLQPHPTSSTGDWGCLQVCKPAHTPRVHFLQEELFIGLTAHDGIRICFFISFLLCVVGEGSKKNSIWKLKHCLWFFLRKIRNVKVLKHDHCVPTFLCAALQCADLLWEQRTAGVDVRPGFFFINHCWSSGFKNLTCGRFFFLVLRKEEGETVTDKEKKKKTARLELRHTLGSFCTYSNLQIGISVGRRRGSTETFYQVLFCGVVSFLNMVLNIIQRRFYVSFWFYNIAFRILRQAEESRRCFEWLSAYARARRTLSKRRERVKKKKSTKSKSNTLHLPRNAQTLIETCTL